MKKNKFQILLLLKKLKQNKSLISLNSLNKEKIKIKNIKEDLNELLNSNKFEKGEILSSALLNQMTNYHNEIQNKLTISENREKYLMQEIKDNLKEINKLNKQKEKIKEKIIINQNKEIEDKEIKSELTFQNKNL